MKYTDEQHAEKLAEMCNGDFAGCVMSAVTNGKLNGKDCFMCTAENKKFCETIEPEDWLAYLRRWPGLHGQKRGDL